MSETRTGPNGQPNAAASNADEPEIEIIDAPPADRSQANRRVHDDDDGENYSQRVRKRIGKLTGRIHVEETARQRAEASLAQLAAENARLRADRFGDRENAASQAMASAEAELATAITGGDAMAQAKANRRIAELATEVGQARAGKAEAERAHQSADQVARTTPVTTTLSPATQAWVDNGNDWFVSDPDMRTDAIAQHHVAIARGIKADTPEYFNFIDKRMRALHPDSFDEAEGAEEEAEPPPRRQAAAATPSQVRRVVPGAGQPAARQKITLTQEEVSIAASLKMTPAQYAASKTALAGKRS